MKDYPLVAQPRYNTWRAHIVWCRMVGKLWLL